MRLITRTEVLAVTRCVGNIGSNMEGKCFTEDLCYRDLYKCSPKKLFKKFVENNFRARKLFVHKKFDEEIDGQKNFGVKICWVKKNSCQKKFCEKNSGSEFFFGGGEKHKNMDNLGII